MRSLGTRRRGFIDLRRISIGDYIVAVASLLTVVSLFLPWFMITVPRQHSEWAFTYSELASIVVILIFIATMALVLYPAIAAQAGFAPLPFATPVVYLSAGALLLLLFVYQLGKYACIQCQGVSRGFGIWLAIVSAVIYLIGAIIRWGSRPARAATMTHDVNV